MKIILSQVVFLTESSWVRARSEQVNYKESWIDIQMPIISILVLILILVAA